MAGSFFICWGLIIFLRAAFAFGIPLIAGHFSGDLAEDLSSGNPEAVALVGVLSGWFYAAITVLLGFVVWLSVNRQGRNEISGVDFGRHKWFKIIVLSVLVGLGALLKYFASTQHPPKEAALLQTFYAHRSSYEHLRDMLQADQGLRRVATWGVETKDGISEAPAVNFPIERYHEYLALLKDAGAKVGWRDDGTHPEVGIMVWGAGFAGETVHIGISWREDVPDRQVPSLDRYFRNHRSSGTKGWVYRHIDGDWYLSTDIGTGY